MILSTFGLTSIIRVVPAMMVAVLTAACSVLPQQMGSTDAVYREAVKSADESVVIRMARNAVDVGDYNSALTVLTQAWRTDPNNSEVASLYADTLIKVGDAETALQVLNKSRGSNEQDSELAIQWAKAQLALSRPEVAIIELQRLRETNENDFRIYNAAGVAFDMMGQHAEAVQSYRSAAALQPGNVAVANNLGLSLALSGQYDEAINILRGLAESDETNQKIRQNLALAYGLKGELVAAKRVASRDLTPQEIEENLRFYQVARASGKAHTFKEELKPTAVEPEPVSERSYQKRTVKALATEPEDLKMGKVPAGDWYLDLGSYPNGARAAGIWQVLQKSMASVTGGLERLAGAGDGQEPLLVGPVGDEANGKALCNKLGKAVKMCKPIKL